MVRLEDIALASGYSLATVSNALRGRGRMTEATRQRIRGMAEEMGYQNNAAASVLASMKRSGRGAEARLPVGWVGLSLEEKSYAGFLSGCAEYGYAGSWIQPREFKSPKQLIRVLWSRGYVGLVIKSFPPAWTEEEWKEADWGILPAVKQYRSWGQLPIPTVRHSAFEYMHFTLKEVRRRGYRRIAVLLICTESATDDSARLGAVLAFQAESEPMGCTVTWHRDPRPVAQTRGRHGLSLDRSTVEWLRTYAPDAIVGFPYNWCEALGEAGFRIPEEVAYAAVISSLEYTGTTQVCGCHPQSFASTRRTVELLHLLICSRSGGALRELVLQDVIMPRWADCGTLPTRAP